MPVSRGSDDAGQVTVAHNPRTVVVEYRQTGDLWQATSPDIHGVMAEHHDLAEVQRTVCGRLGEWLDPVHIVEFRIVEDGA